MTKRTVIILAHPHFERSLANRTIIEEIKRKLSESDSKDSVEIRNIIELYPNYRINIQEEQKALLRADTIVLQFPFYWYSVPAILKLWIDEVLAYGFAYGSEGDKLKGKNLLLSFTVGGPKESYKKEGYNHYTIEELIIPHIQTSNLMGTNFLDPIYTHGMIFIPGVYNNKEDVEAKAVEHANRLWNLIRYLFGL